jgi:hypothetical protein
VENKPVNFARLSAVTLLALLLAMPSVNAAPPLAPGKPAGIKQAEIWNMTTLAVIAGGTAAVVGFALLISSTTPATTSIGGGSGNSVVFSPTTTTTK